MHPDSYYRKLLEDVILQIRPSAHELALLDRVQNEVIRRLGRVLPKEVEIGTMGSVAKGTALRQNRELDIFILMPKSWPLEKMQKSGLDWAKKAMRGLRTELNYAQHPYLQVHIDGVKVDLVPSYKLNNMERIGSAVDRSQLHAKWVNLRLDERLRDDIRLLKQFFKCLGVYGAQTRVEGFSGYLCELLVINYGGFLPTLRAISSWKMPCVIDIEKRYDAGEALKIFAGVPLVVIDPVDPKRNVAAVVSRTSMARAILASRQFLERPSKSFFFGKKEIHSARKLRSLISRRGTCTIVLFFPAPNAVEDILWPQLRKTAQALISALSGAEFRVFGHYFWSDSKRALILFELMENKLPAIRRALGPQVWLEKDVKAFMARHKNAACMHVEHERLVAITGRKYRAPKEVLEDAIKRARQVGIPALFAKALKKRKWGTAEDLLKDDALLEVASDYFSRKI